MKFTKIIAVVTAALMLCMSLAACTGNAKDDGKDTEMKRQAQRYALPRENTAEDQAMLDEFDEIFYNA